MARTKGQNGYAEVGGVEIGERVSFDLEITSAELDATVQGLDWTAVVGGQKSASGSIEVLYDPTDAGQNALVVGSTVALTLFPGGESSGLKKLEGNFLVTSVSTPVPSNDLVKRTYQVKNDGAVTETTIT